MSHLRTKLAAFARTIADEAEVNPSFRLKVEQVLGSGLPTRDPENEKRGGRRTPAVLDPVELARTSESELRRRLEQLDLEQLRDIVAQYGMDTGKLVMKWKDTTRVIEKILEISRGRATKGDAFRS